MSQILPAGAITSGCREPWPFPATVCVSPDRSGLYSPPALIVKRAVVRQLECPHDAPGRMSTPRAAYSASAKEDGMRFDTAMVQQRGAIVRLVQEQILTQGQA